MYNDPYDAGTPKYSTAQSIYDALCGLMQTEEICILSEMFPDVSVEGQEYYYTDNGNILKDRFEELSVYGDRMWVMDLAVWQIDQTEAHDFVYQSLCNADMARRLGFKQLFIDNMLGGYKYDYAAVSEAYTAELSSLDYFDRWEMIKAWSRVMQARGIDVLVTPYPNLCHALWEKAQNLILTKEVQIIAECRALLTSYDDFMLGLRMNQELYRQQEQSYNAKVAALKASYEEHVKRLMAAAEMQGVNLLLDNELRTADSLLMLSS